MYPTKQELLTCVDACRRIGGHDGNLDIMVKDADTGAEAGIIVDNDTHAIVIVASGSDELSDWKHDLNASLDTVGSYQFKPMLAHRGFSESEWSIHESLKSAFLATVQSHPEYRRMFTGHSLGGPTIKVFVLRIANEGFKFGETDSIITFGEPCLGNDVTANRLTSLIATYRVFNNRDRVPKLLDGVGRYVHSGTPIELHDLHGPEGHADSLAAAIFNHCLLRDYLKPITKYECGLNDPFKGDDHV